MLFAVVPLALAASEPYLVHDTRLTLLYSALGLSVLQSARSVAVLNTDAFSAVLMGVLALLLTPAVAGVLVLFGAPVSYAQVETLLCAMVLSVLAVQPLLSAHGLDAGVWRRVASLQLPASGVFYGSVGTLVGAWFGAVPIALDWDRPWQAYPITIVLGAYGGAAVGTLVGSLLEKPVRTIGKNGKNTTVKRRAPRR